MSKCVHKKVIRYKEYVGGDCYAYCIACAKCGKFICSGWSPKECDENYLKLKKKSPKSLKSH